MIAQSQSGTGKTAAFVLAMLSRVDPTKNFPQALCLSPTYELAIQTGEVAAKMAQFCPEIKIRYAVRGEEGWYPWIVQHDNTHFARQLFINLTSCLSVPRGTKLSEHIIIGTPGKVVDWAIKFRFFDLSKLTVFVLDEADVMIATQGHQDQSFRIHKYVSFSRPWFLTTLWLITAFMYVRCIFNFTEPSHDLVKWCFSLLLMSMTLWTLLRLLLITQLS